MGHTYPHVTSICQISGNVIYQTYVCSSEVRASTHAHVGTTRRRASSLKSNKQSYSIQMHRSSCWARPISPEQSGITGTRKLTSGKRRQHRDAADRPTFRRPTSVFLNTIRLKFCKRYSCLLCCHVLKPSVIRWIV